MAAGFVMTMDSLDSIKGSTADGVYGTVRRQPEGHWGGPGYGTFADYASMKPGDNIYFFHDRQLYGCGELVEVGGKCAPLELSREQGRCHSQRHMAPLRAPCYTTSARQAWICDGYAPFVLLLNSSSRVLTWMRRSARIQKRSACCECCGSCRSSSSTMKRMQH